MIEIRRFTSADENCWDSFLAKSKNGVFLFKRSYMEYHVDRFVDHSLLFYENGKLVAILPANERERSLVSHGGLTFGGVVSGDQLKTPTMIEIFAALSEYASARGLQEIIYKPIPYVYHRVAAEEDKYALFRQNARLIRRDLSSAVNLQSRIPYSKDRKYRTKRARSHGFEVRESHQYHVFMAMEQETLKQRYGVQPTHSAEELEMLARRFPSNIRLFGAHYGGAMVAGVVVYENPRVAHTQYMASTPEGRELSAVDSVVDYLLNEVYASFDYFEFGISTEQNGHYLNEGLVRYKESYGARAVVYDWYAWEVS